MADLSPGAPARAKPPSDFLRFFSSSRDVAALYDDTPAPHVAVPSPQTVAAATRTRPSTTTIRAATQAAHQAVAAAAAATPPIAPVIEPTFNVNPDLPLAEQARVRATLAKLKHAFAAPKRTPVASPGVEHAIHLLDNQPVKQAPYRQSPAKQEAVHQEVQRLLAAGLIAPSSSPWSSPVSLVPKPDGSWRMVIDYRRVNAKTRKDAYPVPLIEECLAACKNADWMSIIDIKDAYHHILMALESRGITAFVTPDGLFEWKRMPFGLSNAPATFQRYVDQQLREFIGKFCAVFFDDCLVYTTGTLEQHMQDITAVLTKLHSVGLEASASKCRFAYKELLFVGHIVGKGTIRPDPDKQRAIDEFPEPKTVTELKGFLGLANYYRRFIAGFAVIAAPLYELLRKGTEFVMSQSRLLAFTALKAALTAAPCLYTPNFRLPFILQTDASGVGIAGVLSQNVEGAEHPVGFVSRQLNKAERNYSATEWECLAVVWSVGQFEPFLIDAPFTIVTDHSALQWLATKRMENKRLTRWALTLQEYSYTIQHRPGKANANADALSRCPPAGTAPPEAADRDEHSTLVAGPREPHFIRRLTIVRAGRRKHRPAARPSAVSAGQPPDARRAVSSPLLDGIHEFTLMDPAALSTFCDEQEQDEDLRPLLDYLQHKHLGRRSTASQREQLQRRAASYVFLDVGNDRRALFYHPGAGTRGLSALVQLPPRLVVPDAYKKHILELYHTTPFGGHSGIKHTLRKIASRYYWNTLYNDVTEYVSKCIECQQTKAQRRREEPAKGIPPIPSEPWEMVSMDLAGPFPGNDSFLWILLVVDHFTGYLVTVPLIKADGVGIVRAFVDEVICKFGMPLRILSDRGGQFLSKFMEDLTGMLGIKVNATSAYHPQANGKTERYVGMLKTHLTANLGTYDKRWLDALQTATFAVNASPSETTGFSPFYLNFGRHPRLPGEFLPARYADGGDQRPETYALHLATLVQEAANWVRTNSQNRADQVKTLNEQIKHHLVFSPGDLVWLKDERARLEHHGRLPALAHRYIGPYLVLERISPMAYVIRALHEGETKGLTMTANANHLRAINTDSPGLDNRFAPEGPLDTSMPPLVPVDTTSDAVPTNAPREEAQLVPDPAVPVPMDVDDPDVAPAPSTRNAATGGPAAAAHARHASDPRPVYDTATWPPDDIHPSTRYALAQHRHHPDRLRLLHRQ